MAAKIVKLFSSSSVVICRRLTLPTTSLVQKFGTGTIKKPRRFPQPQYIIRTMSSSGEAAVGIIPEGKTGLIEMDETSSSNAIASSNEASSTEVKPENPNPSSDPVESPAKVDSSAEPEKRSFVRRNKAAILLSYSGQGYFGMQIQNNGTKTIENDLMKAFYDAGAVDKEGFEKPKSIKFQRAARTDKNVSAARNIVSMMVPKDFDVDAVNKHLPDQIRVMDFRRVTKGFDAKLQCCSRTYLYMIPTFAFTPLEEPVVENFRITTDGLENLRKTLKLFEGTKNYHNFTSRKKPTDPSAMRFIMSFTSSDPFVKDGLEYVVLKIKGQSFMLHQIRKMIGLAVAILRGFATVEETMKKAFTLDRIDIPMAPGLGLMLGEAHYDHYNKKFGQDGIHEPLIWDNVADKIEAFCQEKIYTEVTRTEIEEKSMFQWLSTVPFHTYDIREEDVPGGYGPLGKADCRVKKERGELSEEGEPSGDEDDEIPKKKQRQNL